MLKTGDVFPDFTLPDQNGEDRSKTDYAGSWLVVYFYPKDNTSGCTLEAQSFAGLFASLKAKDTAVLGVSADSVKSHCGFAAKLSLPFSILSDQEHALLEATGVWQKKKMAGREYMGIVRTTVLVDPQGIVRAIWPKVKVPGHAETVFGALQDLQSK